MPGTVRVLGLLTLVAVGLLAVSAPVAADSDPTFVDSNVTESTTWDEDRYRVVSNVTIEPDAALTIRPGTTVTFAEGVTLSVAGTLRVNGTAGAPVTLAASKPVAEPGAWGGIAAVGPDRAVLDLEHAHLAHATDGIRVTDPASTVTVATSSFTDVSGDAISVRRADSGTRIEVRDGRFESIRGDGIAVARTDIRPVETLEGMTVVDATFESIEGAGIDLDAKRVRGLSIRGGQFGAIAGDAIAVSADRLLRTWVSGNEISGADRGIALEAWTVGTVTVAENEIAAATGIDLLAERNVHDLALVENRVVDGHTGITVRHDPHRDGFYSFDLAARGNTVADQSGDGFLLRSKLFADSTIAFRNNTVRDNGRDGTRLAVGAFQNATVADNTFRGNGRHGLSMTARHVRDTTLVGNLARENGEAGVTVRARRVMERVKVRDNDLLDNAREGLALESGTPPEDAIAVSANRIAANAYGLVLTGPQTATVANNSIAFNTVGFGPRSPRADVASGVGVVVTGNATAVELGDNDVYGHRIGLSTAVSGTVRAAGNYWGAESGPYHRSINPEGEGNAVETRRGWVDLVEVSRERHGPTYERPVASLSIEPDPATAGTAVELSAAGSTANGTVRTHRFVVNGTPTITESATLTRTVERAGSVPVSLQVEDEMGIESPVTTGAIRVTEPTTTGPTTAAPTASPPTATQPPPPDGGFGPIGLLGGLLGGGLYGMALFLGARGFLQTIRGQLLTVRGRRIHALAAAGVLLWAVSSLPGPSVLRLVAAVGAVLWVGLTGLAYLVVRAR